MWQAAALNLPPSFFSSHTQTWTHKPPIDCSYIWVYSLSISISINHSPHNRSPSTATHTRHRYTLANTKTQIHFTASEYTINVLFYWRVWGADTSALGLLILLSYPNEPCVIHHCPAGSTQPAWMTGRTELRRDRDYHLATRYISIRVSWLPFLKGIKSNKKTGCTCEGLDRISAFWHDFRPLSWWLLTPQALAFNTCFFFVAWKCFQVAFACVCAGMGVYVV